MKFLKSKHIFLLVLSIATQNAIGDTGNFFSNMSRDPSLSPDQVLESVFDQGRPISTNPNNIKNKPIEFLTKGGQIKVIKPVFLKNYGDFSAAALSSGNRCSIITYVHQDMIIEEGSILNVTSSYTSNNLALTNVTVRVFTKKNSFLIECILKPTTWPDGIATIDTFEETAGGFLTVISLGTPIIVD